MCVYHILHSFTIKHVHLRISYIFLPRSVTLNHLQLKIRNWHTESKHYYYYLLFFYPGYMVREFRDMSDSEREGLCISVQTDKLY